MECYMIKMDIVIVYYPTNLLLYWNAVAKNKIA